MAFIKVGNTVISTAYIAAVDLNRTSRNGKAYVVIQMSAPAGFLKPGLKEFRFSGEPAKKLLAYFSNPSNVVDLSKSLSFYDQAEREQVTTFSLSDIRGDLEEAWNPLNLGTMTTRDQTSHHPHQTFGDAPGDRSHRVLSPLLPFLIQ